MSQSSLLKSLPPPSSPSLILQPPHQDSGKEEEEEEEGGEGEEKNFDNEEKPCRATPYVAYRIDKSLYINFTNEINEICSCYTGICPLSESALDALDEVCRFWVNQLFEKAAAAQDAQPKTPDCALQPKSFGAFLAPAQLLRMEMLIDFFQRKSSFNFCPQSEGENYGEIKTKSHTNVGTCLDSVTWEESVRRAVTEQGEDPALMDREILRFRISLEKDGRFGRKLNINDSKIVSFVRPINKRFKKFKEWAGVNKLKYKVSKMLCEIAAQLLLEWMERIAHGTRESTANLSADDPLMGSHVKAHIISLGPNWVCPPPLFA